MCAFSQLLHPVSTRNFETAPSVTVTSRVYWGGGISYLFHFNDR